MAQAPNYDRSTDFAGDEQNNRGGRGTVATADVNAELDAASESINALISNQSLNQRDDGEIRDQRVKLHTLAPEVVNLIASFGGTIRGAWLTATAYVVKDVVSQGGSTYVCAVAHTSGVFAADYAAVRWVLVQLGAATAASGVPFTPTATLAATDVQAAIDESDTENRALSAAALAAANAAATASAAALATLIASFSNTSDLAQGDAQVGVKQPAADAVAQTQHRKNQDAWSLADWGAVGDGATDDTTAILRALNQAPTGCTLLLKGTVGDVFHTTGISVARSDITIKGNRKPKSNSGFTALEGGTIIRGTFLINGNNLALEDFGADHGTVYSNLYKGGAGGDGLVVHDTLLSSIRRNIRVNRVTGMTRLGNYLDPSAAFHAVLLEGLENGSSNDVTGVGGWFGVVLKVANWTFNGLTAIENDAAGVYIKSNSYGPVANVVGSNVVVIAGSSRAHRGFLVSASDAELANVAVSNVTVIGGAAGGAVVIEGEVTQPAVNVVITGITTRSTGNGVAAIGPVYASSMQGTIDKPSSAVCLQVAANGSAVQPNDIELDLRVNIDGSLSASTTTAITATNAKVFLKRFHATYSYSEPALVTATANTKIGDFFGRLLSDRTEANLQNGWAVSTGGNKCGMHTRFGVTSGYGRIIYSGASSDTFFTLSAGAFPGMTQLIPALGFDGLTGEPATVYVQVSSGGVMSIYPNRASYAANLSYIDLSSVRFNAQLPTTGPL